MAARFLSIALLCSLIQPITSIASPRKVSLDARGGRDAVASAQSWAASLRDLHADAGARPRVLSTPQSKAMVPNAATSVPDGSGGVYIAFADTRDGSGDIYLLRVTNTGVPFTGWPSEGVPVCTAAGDQFEPFIVTDNNGGVVVAWLDFRDHWKTPDIYVQRVAPSGATLWTANGVSAIQDISLLGSIHMSPDATNGAFLAWSTIGAVDEDVFITQVEGGGSLQGGWTPGGDLVCDLKGRQHDPKVTSDNTGAAIITWTDDTSIGAQRQQATNAIWGANGIVIDAQDDVVDPFPISDGTTGGAFVFWVDAGSGTIMGQRLDFEGSAQWTAGGVDVGGTNAVSDVLVVPDGTGGSIMAWNESTIGTDGLAAQRVDASGAPQWGADGVPLVSFPSVNAELGDIVTNAGAAVFVWQDHRDGPNEPNLFAQSYTALGVRVWSSNGEAVCDAVYDQFRPVIASDGSTGTIIAWLDTRRFDVDVFAQRMRANGTNQLAFNGVAVYSNPGVQGGAGVFHTSDDGVLLFWNEKVNGQYDIRAEKFDEDGVPVGLPITVCGAAGHQYLTAMTDDGAGGVIVGWTDLRTGAEDLYAQRLDADGTLLWAANGVVVCGATGRQGPVKVANDGAGGAIFAWEDHRITSDPNIFAQRIDATGAAQWLANGVAVCSNGFAQATTAIAADVSGGAFIAWADFRSPFAPAIFAQRLNGSGVAQWSADGVSVASYTLFDSPGVSAAVAGGSNDVIILIHRTVVDIGTFDFTSVLDVQKVTSLGAPLWGASGSTVCDVTSLCANERMTDDGAGGAYVAWSDGRTGVYDIYEQRVASVGGVPQWTANGVAVCDATSWQHLGGFARDLAGHTYLTWADERAGFPDVYAQRMNTVGAAQWTADGRSVATPVRGQYHATISPIRFSATARQYVAWTDNRAGTERYVFMQRLDGAGAGVWGVDGITRVALSLVATEASPGRVRVIWQTSEATEATVYRRSSDGPWQAIATMTTDGNGRVDFEDAEVTPGLRYGYRLGVSQPGGEVLSPEVWIDVPSGLALSMQGFSPNPSAGDLFVAFTIPRAEPASLELIDVSGRRVATRDFAGLPAGRHTIRLDQVRVPAGMYFLRLSQGGQVATARGLVVR